MESALVGIPDQRRNGHAQQYGANEWSPEPDPLPVEGDDSHAEQAVPDASAESRDKNHLHKCEYSDRGELVQVEER